MNETGEILLVVDEQGALSGDLLDRLMRNGSLRVSRTVDETRDRIEAGTCRAILIAVSGNPIATLSLAFRVHEMDPGLPVMVMEDGFKPRLTRLAERAGIRLLSKDDDVATWTTAESGRLERSVMLL